MGMLQIPIGRRHVQDMGHEVGALEVAIFRLRHAPMLAIVIAAEVTVMEAESREQHRSFKEA